MSHEIEFDGIPYISSKRAAELCDYTQDYIGQLARSGQIDARRVNGLWYVNEKSIRSHREAANAPEQAESVGISRMLPKSMNSIVTFDGREYISSRRAASLTGYSQDYISQLGRESKVPARVVGNRWYVAKKDLLEHKAHNDALLAKVQAEAVGIVKPDLQANQGMQVSAAATAEPVLAYHAETADLLPKIPHKEPSMKTTSAEDTASAESAEMEDLEKEQHIPLTVLKTDPRVSERRNQSAPALPRTARKNVLILQPEMDTIPEKRRLRSGILAGSLMVAAVVLAVGVSSLFLQKNDTFAGLIKEGRESGLAASTAASLDSFLTNIFDTIFNSELEYSRQ